MSNAPRSYSASTSISIPSVYQLRDESAEFVAGLSAQATGFEQQRARTQLRLAGRQA